MQILISLKSGDHGDDAYMVENIVVLTAIVMTVIATVFASLVRRVGLTPSYIAGLLCLPYNGHAV